MRVLVFSDIHANKYALNVVLKGEKFDEAVFLGFHPVQLQEM